MMSSSSSSELGALPPGWDTKFDPRTGRYYFINHYTKSTSWEDPRVRYQQIGKATSSSSAAGGKEAFKDDENVLGGGHQPKVGGPGAVLQAYPIGTIPPSAKATAAEAVPSGGDHRPAPKSASGGAPGASHPTLVVMLPPPVGHQSAGVMSDEVIAMLQQHHILQDLANKRAGSPVLGRATTPQPLMGTQAATTTAHMMLNNQSTASPLPLARLQLEESLNSVAGIGSPMSQRSNLHLAARRESHVLANISEVDSVTGLPAMTVPATSNDTADSSVQVISAMFPTVEESHIRELLKKYHNSQAVVISALQVAKFPFITPGPSSSTALVHHTPPPSRHATLPGGHGGALAGLTSMTGSLPHYYYGGGAMMTSSHMAGLLKNGGDNGGMSVSSSGYPTPRPGSAASGFDNSFYMGSPQIAHHHHQHYPLATAASNFFRSFPRPHSSPKMKLRYLKSVFPTVEEYLLLDVLSNSDNNVQKAADRLVKMGYVKRDTPSAPRLHARRKEEERLAEKRTPLPKPPPIKTDKEKEDLRRKMKDRYEVKFDIPERILFMALESVLFDEDQANSLIMSMIEDDLKRKKKKEADRLKEKEKRKSPKLNRRSLEVERMPVNKHSSPKHEPAGKGAPMAAGAGGGLHGKKGWSARTGSAASVAASGMLREDAARAARSTSSAVDGGRVAGESTRARGPNPALRRGPNDDLLLTDYVTWNGPDMEMRNGPNQANARGPNPANRQVKCQGQQVQGCGRVSLAKGPNPELRKGPSPSNVAAGRGRCSNNSNTASANCEAAISADNFTMDSIPIMV